MKLYDSIGPNPHLLRMFVAEKAINLPMVKLDLVAGENRQPAHLLRNPTGATSALELDDGSFITEVTVIAEYLEELYPAHPMIGTTPAERAETRMWTRRIDLNIAEPMINGFRAAEGRALFDSRMKLVSVEAANELKALGRERLLWLDTQMAGRQYICGERFSLADIHLFAFMTFGASVGQPIPDEATWVNAWYARVSARPSAKA